MTSFHKKSESKLCAKGSQQAELTGFKGSIVRNVTVGKTRSSLEKALQMIKTKSKQ